MKSDSKINACNALAIVLIVFGIFMALLSLLLVVISITADGVMAASFFITFAFSVLLTIWGIYLQSFLTRCISYSHLIMSKKANTVSQLAAIAARPVTTVHQELMRMIDMKYLYGIYINQYNGKIVFRTRPTPPPVHRPPIHQPFVRMQFAVVKCQNCGGSTKLPRGSYGRCDYCDSAIRG